jgi:RecA-family ATPase
MKDIKIIKKEENKEYISYNLTKKLVEVFNTNQENYEPDETPEGLFEKDLPTVKKLVKEKIRKLNSEIKNSKVLISMLSKSKNKFKLAKEKRKLKKNNLELSYLTNWLKTN